MTCPRSPGTFAPALVWTALLCIGLLAPAAFAQDNGEYKKLYDDALAQLKESQDRKTELNRENEQLKAKLAELEAETQTLRRDAASHAERTFFLRSHYAAWKRFVGQNPELKKKWDQYLGAAAAELPEPAVDPLVPLEPAVEDKPAEQEPAEQTPAEQEPAEPKPDDKKTVEPATTQPAAAAVSEQPPTDAEPASTPATAPSTSPASE